MAADFETVRGPWGVRGEIAAFVDDELQSTRAVRGVSGQSVTAGVGVDRRAGDYRVAANVLWSWSGVDDDDPSGRRSTATTRSSGPTCRLSLPLTDRSLARHGRCACLPCTTRRTRRPLRASLPRLSVRDNVWLEGSAGVFTGSSLDVIGRLTRRDFAYARLKVFF